MTETTGGENLISQPALYIPQGWQCPACSLVHAPHVPSCACQMIRVTLPHIVINTIPTDHT